MRILKVIHGYPPAYNAGSEVYTQTLCRELAKRHHVTVFTREENVFQPDYAMRTETDEHASSPIDKHLINLPTLRQRYSYHHKAVNTSFRSLVATLRPDIIHVGHLNHLSLSILDDIKGIPLLFTLHDYWLICPRGQFIQRNGPGKEVWAYCGTQEDAKCAQHCFRGYFSGYDDTYAQDLDYWTHWVRRRQEQVQKLIQRVDIFIAPSRYLQGRFIEELQIPSHKITYLDYGFDHARLRNRQRATEDSFVFGYIGTHIPAKGIHLLLQAFARLKGTSLLRIWGRWRSEVTPSLRQLVATFPADVQKRITWLDEYTNDNIISVFNQVDSIVVPSIWVENSPLVIHEALQAGVPVITADKGGMGEFIRHEENGLLFKFRDCEDLATQMQHLLDNPTFAQRLGQRRYLGSSTGDVPSIESHVERLEEIYGELLSARHNLPRSSL